MKKIPRAQDASQWRKVSIKKYQGAGVLVPMS